MQLQFLKVLCHLVWSKSWNCLSDNLQNTLGLYRYQHPWGFDSITDCLLCQIWKPPSWQNFSNPQKFGKLLKLGVAIILCSLLRPLLLKVAWNSFQHFPRHKFWRVNLATLHWLMPNSWYLKSAQSVLNMLWSILWHNRLPKQLYDLLKHL